MPLQYVQKFLILTSSEDFFLQTIKCSRVNIQLWKLNDLKESIYLIGS